MTTTTKNTTTKYTTLAPGRRSASGRGYRLDPDVSPGARAARQIVAGVGAADLPADA